MASELLIIRHGESVSNAARVVQKPEVPLSEQGRSQALRVAERLAAGGVESILSSDLARAWATAEAISLATGAELVSEPLLAERNYGELRGTAYAELGDRDIFAYDFEPPGGESGAVFDARVDQAWEAVIAHANRVQGRLAVVTHGLVCGSLALRHLDTGGLEAPLQFANTSLTVVSGKPPWSVSRLACAEHLSAAPTGGGVV